MGRFQTSTETGTIPRAWTLYNKALEESPELEEKTDREVYDPSEEMVSPAGLEPAACGLGNRRSIRLSYGDTDREAGWRIPR